MVVGVGMFAVEPVNGWNVGRNVRRDNQGVNGKVS